MERPSVSAIQTSLQGPKIPVRSKIPIRSQYIKNFVVQKDAVRDDSLLLMNQLAEERNVREQAVCRLKLMELGGAGCGEQEAGWGLSWSQSKKD